MDTPKKPDQPCPGPTKTARSRVDSLRDKRQRLRDEFKKVSAQLQQAVASADRLSRIEDRQRDRAETEQLGTLCKRAGLDRYRLCGDAKNQDAPAPLDTQLLGGALSWLCKKMSVMSAEDMDVFREEEAALIKEMQVKKDARVKMDAPTQKGGGTPHPTFESLE